MKRPLVLLAFLIAPLLFGADLRAQARWIKLDSVTDRQFMAVQFFNADRGYVAARDGTFMRTFNGGKTWEELFLPRGIQHWINLHDMHFHDTLTGVVVGSLDTNNGVLPEPRATIWWTYDGGKTWDPKVFDEPGTIQFVHFLGRKFGFFATTASDGLGRSKFYTTDGGGFQLEHWQKKEMYPSPERVRGMAFIDNAHAILSGDDEFVIPSNLYRTDDGGDSWQTYVGDQGGSGASFDGLHWIPDGLLGTTGSRIMLSQDSGRNWFTVGSASGTAYYHKFVFLDDAYGFAVPLFGPIMRTTNGGFAWHTMELPEPAVIHDIWPLQEDLAFAVGAGGKMFKLTTASSVRQEDERITISIHPNPASYFVTVKSELASPTGVLIDQLGRTLANFNLSSNGSARIDLNELSAGAYSIVIGDQVKRLIVAGSR